MFETLWKLIELIIPFAILILTLRNERKQNAKYNKCEVKLQYLTEFMNWLNELQFMAYIVSDKAAACMELCSAEEYGKRYGEFNDKANAMMEKCLVGVSVYKTLTKSLCIQFDVEEIRSLTGNFIREMRRENRDNLSNIVIENNNNSTKEFQKEIELKISLVGKLITELLEDE